MNETTTTWIDLASEQADIAAESVFETAKEFVNEKDAQHLADQAWARTIRFELWSPESKTIKEMGASDEGIVCGNIIDWLRMRAGESPKLKKYDMAFRLLEEGWFAFK